MDGIVIARDVRSCLNASVILSLRRIRTPRVATRDPSFLRMTLAHGRRDMTLALGLIVACLIAESAVLRVGIDDLDEGYFVQQGMRVLHGQIPYRDFQTLYTPGLLYVHAGLFGLL